MVIIAFLLATAIPTNQEDYIQQEERKIAKARKILEVNPTDPEAALAVGKFLCFVKNSWDEGLPYLAVGKDQKLVTLAMTDLGRQPIEAVKGSPLTGATIDFGEEVAVELIKGDQWWTEARNHQGSVEKINIYNRAAYWYRRAVKKVDDVHRKKLYARINAHARAMGSIEVKVSAATTLWHDTGIEVVAGQQIRFTCKGAWAYSDDAERVGWQGYHNPVKGQPLPMSINFYCLSAKVGDSGKLYPVYKENPYVAETDGHLIVGPNAWAPGGVGELTVNIEVIFPF
jgi:hypothetical protein